MKDKKMPIYRKTFLDLKNMIQKNYSVGDLLPPEPELEKQYNVSRITIRKAIQMLADEGLVSVRQGQGTTVTSPRTVQRLNYITSLSETLRNSGYTIVSKNNHIDATVPEPEIAKLLQLEEGVAVVRLQRIIEANDKPLAIVTNYIMNQYADELWTKQEEFVSLYKFLEENSNVKLESGIDYITAKSANIIQSNILKLPVNSPLIHVRRVTYTNNIKPTPVTCDELLINASRYVLAVNLIGRPPM